jgi:hypothetical protein
MSSTDLSLNARQIAISALYDDSQYITHQHEYCPLVCENVLTIFLIQWCRPATLIKVLNKARLPTKTARGDEKRRRHHVPVHMAWQYGPGHAALSRAQGFPVDRRGTHRSHSRKQPAAVNSLLGMGAREVGSAPELRPRENARFQREACGRAGRVAKEVHRYQDHWHGIETDRFWEANHDRKKDLAT